MSVKISLTTLKKQVEDGMKKSQLAEHYGMSELQVGKLLKQAGLKIRKFHKPAFELVNDELVTIVTEVEFQPVVDVVEDEALTFKSDVAPEDLFASSPDETEKSIIFEDSSVEKVEDDGDPLLAELLN